MVLPLPQGAIHSSEEISMILWEMTSREMTSQESKNGTRKVKAHKL